MIKNLIIMGVSGSGKSTIGRLLAEKLNRPFYDADDFHPEENLEKMKQGKPLNDSDREPWLNQLSELLQKKTKEGIILACSSLKQSYRDVLDKKSNNRYVYLKGDFKTIESRLLDRSEHFFDPVLLKSQFDILEPPGDAISVDISQSVEDVVKEIMEQLNDRRNSELGIFGFGVMGRNLAMNAYDAGLKISVYNRREDSPEYDPVAYGREHDLDDRFAGSTDLKLFIDSLAKPKVILLMVTAGDAVDTIINKLLPLLDSGDILIDGGNAFYRHTESRIDKLALNGVKYLGLGISGGEKGARYGASMMAGGDQLAFTEVQSILEKLTAFDQKGGACLGYFGQGSAGHFIKMVHNGIEYVEMQLLAEVYHLLKQSMSNSEIGDVFLGWNSGPEASYLLEITSEILKESEDSETYVDRILDVAGSKGTGSWMATYCAENGLSANMIYASIWARAISAQKEARTNFSIQLKRQLADHWETDLEMVLKAYSAARIINHHQGFEVIRYWMNEEGIEFIPTEIARVWTNGCIIRSKLMQELVTQFTSSDSILKNQYYFKELSELEAPLKEFIIKANEADVPIPSFHAAHNYWISITTENLPANLIQAQRHKFGGHAIKFKKTNN